MKQISMDDGTITPDTINELYALGLLKKTETNRPHPNLTEFHEVFVDGDDVCLVFGLCSRNLEAQLEEMPLQMKLMLRYKRPEDCYKRYPAWHAEMHNHGVMHHDIKPSNILVKDENVILSRYLILVLLHPTYIQLPGISFTRSRDSWLSSP